MKVATLSDRFDIDALRALNTDPNGDIYSEKIDVFLDWAKALLKRIPERWQKILPQTPGDLENLISETERLLTQLVALANESSISFRAATLNNLAPQALQVMGRSINSIKDLVMLQMVADDQRLDTEKAIDDIRTAERAIKEKLQEAESILGRLSEMEAASKESTAKIAASGRARVFHTEGRSYRTAANSWLGATILLGGVLTLLAFGFAFGVVLPVGSNDTPAQVASLIFGKVLILGSVGAAVAFTAKQYAANRHNAVQNFHRSSALRTYRALLAATRDEAVHDAILNQAAQAIFAASDTGYSKSSTGYDHAPMVQLIQGAVRGSGTTNTPT